MVVRGAQRRIEVCDEHAVADVPGRRLVLRGPGGPAVGSIGGYGPRHQRVPDVASVPLRGVWDLALDVWAPRHADDLHIDAAVDRQAIVVTNSVEEGAEPQLGAGHCLSYLRGISRGVGKEDVRHRIVASRRVVVLLGGPARKPAALS